MQSFSKFEETFLDHFHSLTFTHSLRQVKLQGKSFGKGYVSGTLYSLRLTLQVSYYVNCVATTADLKDQEWIHV